MTAKEIKTLQRKLNEYRQGKSFGLNADKEIHRCLNEIKGKIGQKKMRKNVRALLSYLSG